MPKSGQVSETGPSLAATTAPSLLQAGPPLESWMSWSERSISDRFLPCCGEVQSIGVCGSWMDPPPMVTLMAGPLIPPGAPSQVLPWGL